MQLTKQDLFLIFGCFGCSAAQDDKQLQASAVHTMGLLVTLEPAEKAELLEGMRTAAVAVRDKLPSVIEKLDRELAAVQGGAK